MNSGLVLVRFPFVVRCLLLLVASLFTEAARACSCLPPPPPKEALAQAAAVFSGKVEKAEVISLTETNAGQVFTNEIKKVTLRVAESWKGTNARELVVYTPVNSAMCGYNFVQGETYLVYASEVGTVRKTKELHTNLCTRTRVLSRAQEDLRALGHGTKPPAAGQTGSVK